MIVPDTNIIAYALIEGPRTALARRALTLDPDWRLPALWAHEFLNILATYVRLGGAPRSQALRLWRRATALLNGCVTAVDMELALELAAEHAISAYNAQFVALAMRTGAVLITEDRRLRRTFPSLTASLESFCKGNPSS